MSLEAMTWALAAQVGDPTRKLVLIALANHAHKNGRNSWASKQTIAEYVEVHPKTVQRHLHALAADGWIRDGDQAQVAHVRADRRPTVYDLAMSEARQAAWKSDRAHPGRGSDLHPRDPGDEGTAPLPRDEVDEGAHGGTPVSARGDTALSPEPRTNLGTSPQPPASGGRCARPGPTPHDNCRGCGTTNRQLEEQRRRDAGERRRQADAAAAAADREARATMPPPDPAVIARARAAARGVVV